MTIETFQEQVWYPWHDGKFERRDEASACQNGRLDEDQWQYFHLVRDRDHYGRWWFPHNTRRGVKCSNCGKRICEKCIRAGIANLTVLDENKVVCEDCL